MLSDDDMGELMQIEEEIEEIEFQWKRVQDIRESDPDLFDTERTILRQQFFGLKHRYTALTHEPYPDDIDFD